MSVSTVLVVGGGITGSMLALALADRGVQVELVEISPVWHGVGHGITVQGNALAAFDKVGVLAEMQTLGIAFHQMRMLHADGSLIAEVPTPRTGGRGLPATMGALRSDLQAVLCERVYRAGVGVRLGLTVRRLEVSTGDVEFSDGSTGSYDLVVGADGIRSAVRSLLNIATEPQRSGMSIWRVVAPRPPELDCAEVYYGGPRFKAGYSPISADRCYAYLLDEDDAADTGRPLWEQLHERSQGYGGTWGKIRTTIGPDSERLLHQDRVAAGRSPLVPGPRDRDRGRRARLPAADRPGRGDVRRGRRRAGRASNRARAGHRRAARVHGAAAAQGRDRRA